MFGSIALGIASFAVAQGVPVADRPTSTQVDQTLRVEAVRVKATADPRVVVYEEGVKAFYDVTTVRADKLTLYLEENQKRGMAEGNVILEDPAGTATADRLEFNWNDRTGVAENILVESGGAILRAERANVAPGRWELLNVSATTCGRDRPIYSVSSPRIVVQPGRRGVAKNATLRILGNKLITIPQANFSLDKRVVGIRFPGVSFKRGTGLGVTWSSGVMVDDHTSLTGGFSSFPNRLPGYGIELARSRKAPTAETGPISPQSELSERFSYGYFEHINVPSPGHEHARVAEERDTWSVGSHWNMGVESGRGSRALSKPLEVAYERSADLGSVSSIHQVRAHRIREHGGDQQNRIMTQHVFGLPPVRIAPKLDGHLRLNASGFLNEDSTYGWARAQMGLTFQPLRQLRLGAAYMLGGDVGTPAFNADQLFSTKAWHVRGDLDLGSTRASVLGKYDVHRKRWFDHEYNISQVIGCFEAFVLWRQFPSDYRFGVRLRADLFFEALQSRTFNRRTRQRLGADGPAKG